MVTQHLQVLQLVTYHSMLKMLKKDMQMVKKLS